MTASDWGPDSPATTRFRAFYDWPAPVEFDAELPDDIDGPDDERDFLLDAAPFSRQSAVRVEPVVSASTVAQGATNPGVPDPSAIPSGNDGSGQLRAEVWQPGDPVYVEKPRRQHCLNAGCGTTWVGADVAECPECGGLVGAAAVSEPLCVLDESNDMEAFAALPECVLCGGTGKQIPDGFWGEEPVSEDDATVTAVGQAIMHALARVAGEDYDSPKAAWSEVGRAAVRALQTGSDHA